MGRGNSFLKSRSKKVLYIVTRIDKQNSNKAMQKMEKRDRKMTNPYESLIENSCVMLPRSSRTVLWDDFSEQSHQKSMSNRVEIFAALCLMKSKRMPYQYQLGAGFWIPN